MFATDLPNMHCLSDLLKVFVNLFKAKSISVEHSSQTCNIVHPMNAYIVWNNKIRVKFKGKGKVIIIFQ